MARSKRRSPDGGSERPREEYIAYRRTDTGLSVETLPLPEVRSVSDAVDPDVVEAARLRALDVGTERNELDEGEEENGNGFGGFLKRGGKRIRRVGTGSVKVAVGASVVFTYLGYRTTRLFARGTLVAIDWLAQKMNKLGDKLIDKNIFLLKYLVNPIVSILDGVAKSFGLDKTLAAHLRKNDADRKKLAEKFFKDYRASQQKQEKKEDAAATKSMRQKKLVEVLGQDVADVLEKELDALDKANEPKAADEPQPAEAAKAA